MPFLPAFRQILGASGVCDHARYTLFYELQTLHETCMKKKSTIDVQGCKTGAGSNRELLEKRMSVRTGCRGCGAFAIVWHALDMMECPCNYGLSKKRALLMWPRSGCCAALTRSARMPAGTCAQPGSELGLGRRGIQDGLQLHGQPAARGGGARQGSARLAAHPPTAAAALRQRLVPRPLHSQLPSGPAPQPEARRSAAAGMTRQLGVRVPSPFAWRAPVPSPPARPTPWSPGS